VALVGEPDQHAVGQQPGIGVAPGIDVDPGDSGGVGIAVGDRRQNRAMDLERLRTHVG